MATIPPINSDPAVFKAAADSLLDEARQGDLTPARMRSLAAEDAEIRRRWRLAHGADDGLTFLGRLRDVL